MSGGIGFSEPRWLLLLPLVWLFPALLVRRSLANLPVGRGRLALGLRLLVLHCLVLALAGLALTGQASRQCVLYALDVSDSVPSGQLDDALQQVNRSLKDLPVEDRAGLVVFGAGAALEAHPSLRPGPWSVHSLVDRRGTNLAEGLRMALASFPDGYQRRVVLLTDGNETAGNGIAEAQALPGHGVDLKVYRIGSRVEKEVMVDRLSLPARAKDQETFDVQVALQSTHSGRGTVKLYRNHVYVGSSQVDYKPGKNVYTFEQKADSGGVKQYRAVLEVAGDDGRAGNNAAEGFTWVEGKPAMLYVHGPLGPSRAFVETMRQHGFRLEAVPPSAVPVEPSGLLAYQVVILDNVDSSGFNDRQLKVLASYVRDLGGGLLAVGGDHAFGPGGYYRTPVEDVLPVTMDITQKKYRPQSTMVVLIDNSGSMSYEERGVSKLQLAAEGASRVLETLLPSDRYGLNVTDTKARWVIRPQPVGVDIEALDGRVRSIKVGGGGIYVYTGLKSVFDEVDRETSQVRHVIVFADTADADQPIGERGEHIFDLAGRMLAHRITVSVVGIGRAGDKDISLLEGLAQAGGGRFHFTDDMFSIPRIFSRDAMLASRAVLVDKEFTPRWSDPAPFLGNLKEMPALRGHVAVSPRAGASYPFWAGDEDPLLAYWNCGLGRSVAYTSQVAGTWGEPLLRWDGFPGFFSGILKWLGRDMRRGQFPVRVESDHGIGRVVVDALSEDGEFLNFLKFKARVAPPDLEGEGFVLDLAQTAPGRYEATFPLQSEGLYLVNVIHVTKEGELVPIEVSGLSVPTSPEQRFPGPDDALLGDLVRVAGGALITDLSGVNAHDRAGTVTRREVWRELVLLALLLFLVDIAVRRVSFSAEELSSLRAHVKARLARLSRAEDPPPQGFDQLRERKRAVSEKLARPLAVELAALDPGTVPTASAPTAAPPAPPADPVVAPAAAPEVTPDRASGPPPDPSPPESHTARLLKARNRARDQARKKE